MNQDSNYSLSERGPTFGPKVNGVVLNGALSKDAYVRLGFLRLNKNEAYLKNPNRSLATTILDGIFAPKPYEVSRTQKKKRYLQQSYNEMQRASGYESNNYFSSSRLSADYNTNYQGDYYEHPEYYASNNRAYSPVRDETQEIAYQKVSPLKTSPTEKLPSKKVEFDGTSTKKPTQIDKATPNSSTNQQAQRGRLAPGGK